MTTQQDDNPAQGHVGEVHTLSAMVQPGGTAVATGEASVGSAAVVQRGETETPSDPSCLGLAPGTVSVGAANDATPNKAEAAMPDLVANKASVEPMITTPDVIAMAAGDGKNEPPKMAGTTADEPPPDPFDPQRLRLSQDFGATLGVRKVVLTVPVRKPNKETWVRTHPEEKYRLNTLVLELKGEREMFLIAPDLWSELATESTVSPRMLFTTIDRDGTVFLWPVRLPGADGKIDDWSRSALEAATMATTHWVRVAANMNLGAYDVFTTSTSLSEPNWPEMPFRDLLAVGFKDHYIESLDHPVLRRLRGEV